LVDQRLGRVLLPRCVTETVHQRSSKLRATAWPIWPVPPMMIAEYFVM
jgi:hypothetical protein